MMTNEKAFREFERACVLRSRRHDGRPQFQRPPLVSAWRRQDEQQQRTGLIDPYSLPGMGTPLVSTENTFLAGTINSWQIIGVVIVSTAVDAGSTPTTTLRKGLCMGAQGTLQLAPGVMVAQYNPAASDGSQYGAGILLEDVNMYDDPSGGVANKYGRLVWMGYVKASQLYGLDGAFRRQVGNRIWFDDGLVDYSQYQYIVYANSGSVTVVAADNNKVYSTLGGTGATTFTLPALASVWSGWRCVFYNEVGQNMAVTAPSGKLVTFNNATATSATFSTSGNLIGACCEVTVNSNASKYLTKFFGANTVTVS